MAKKMQQRPSRIRTSGSLWLNYFKCKNEFRWGSKKVTSSYSLKTSGLTVTVNCGSTFSEQKFWGSKGLTGDLKGHHGSKAFIEATFLGLTGRGSEGLIEAHKKIVVVHWAHFFLGKYEPCKNVVAHWG